MPIIRVEHRDRYLTVDKRTIEDPRLSLRARGLLATLLCKPDDWSIDSTRLAEEVQEGRDAIRTAARQLEEAGYFERRQIQNEKGRWATEIVVRERPTTAFQASVKEDETAGQTDDGLPGVGFPVVGKPGVGFPGANKKTQTDKPLPPAAARKRDFHFDALLEAIGITDSRSLTKSARGAINAALKQIRDTGAEPAEIRRRAGEYRKRFPNATLTAPALAKQWPLLGPRAPTDDRAQAEALGAARARHGLDEHDVRQELESRFRNRPDLIEAGLASYRQHINPKEGAA